MWILYSSWNFAHVHPCPSFWEVWMVAKISCVSREMTKLRTTLFLCTPTYTLPQFLRLRLNPILLHDSPVAYKTPRFRPFKLYPINEHSSKCKRLYQVISLVSWCIFFFFAWNSVFINLYTLVLCQGKESNTIIQWLSSGYPLLHWEQGAKSKRKLK